MCVPRLNYMCAMTHSYVWHDSLTCVPWLIHNGAMTHSYVWHDSFICVTWLIDMCHLTHSYVCHVSLTCVAWLIHMCGMTHAHVWHDSFTFVAWLIADTTHKEQYTQILHTSKQSVDSDVCHDLVTCMTRLIHMCAITDLLICMCHDVIHVCDMTPWRVCHDSGRIYTRQQGISYVARGVQW